MRVSFPNFPLPIPFSASKKRKGGPKWNLDVLHDDGTTNPELASILRSHWDILVVIIYQTSFQVGHQEANGACFGHREFAWEEMSSLDIIHLVSEGAQYYLKCILE